MKANDLMVGDYISVKPSGMPIKVAAVHHKKVAYHAVVNKLAWVRESLLEPIPLTPEILEKNGFEKQQFGHFIYENDDVNLRIAFYPKNRNYTNGCYDYIDIEKGCANITEMPIDFVHELQRVLRILETNKDIVL